MADLKPIIAKNIIDLRKSINWTQAELAQKLNYSDKAVSKWERAESIPDVAVLKEIADLFHVTIDYLLETDHTKSKTVLQIVSKHKKRNRLIITLLSASLVFLIATLIFVFWELSSLKLSQPSWIVYVYAFPVACIVLLVFNSIWGKGKINFAIISSLVWSTLLSVYLSFPSPGSWLIFIIGIPGQIIILLWANFRLKGHHLL
jgi:transcriptional regulator with XRE-family HTH domain